MFVLQFPNKYNYFKRSTLKLLCLLFLLSILLTGCEKKYSSRAELIQRAEKEIPAATVENLKTIIAGSFQDGEDYLFWFVTGNTEFSYLPIEFHSKNGKDFTFIKTFHPLMRATDIAVQYWKNGVSFLVNNPTCQSIQITLDTGKVEQIPVENIPFAYFSEEVFSDSPSSSFEYLFLDKNGNIID